MAEIHCHCCGGFIVNPAGTTYLPPSETTPPATPHTRLCTCERSVVYGAPPGYMSSPGLPGPRIHVIRSASRN